MGRKGIVGTLLCGVGATLILPTTALAQMDRVSSVEKGSVVIFSKVEIRWNAAGQLVQDTFLSLTNDYPGDVRVQLYFVNGDPPLNEPGVRFHPGWNRLDNEITLTANQPTYWSALTGQPANGGLSPFTALDPGGPLTQGRPAAVEPGFPAGDRVMRGFIVGWAVNASNEQIRWNHLKGEGTLVDYRWGTAWEYNTWAFKALDPVVQGQVVGTAGAIQLDGTNYAPAFAQLLLNFQAVGSVAYSNAGIGALVISNTDLTLHPVSVDLRQDTLGPVLTKAEFNVWNMNEVKFSGATRCITCWDQTFLSNYALPNHFLRANLQTDHGKARIDGVASTQCPGSVDAAILGVAAKLLFFNGGVNHARAGTNLIGMGEEAAAILYDVLPPPPEAPELPSLKPTNSELKGFVRGLTTRSR